MRPASPCHVPLDDARKARFEIEGSGLQRFTSACRTDIDEESTDSETVQRVISTRASGPLGWGRRNGRCSAVCAARWRL
jgi:hypothetical protein